MKGFTNFLVILSIILIIIGIILCIVGAVSGGSYNMLKLENYKTIEESYEGIEKIKIDVSYCDVEIKYGNKFQIIASVPESSKLNSNVKGKIWEISDTKKSRIFNFGPFVKNESKITIYIPEDVKLENVDINVGACNLAVEEIVSKKMNLNAGVGSIVVNNMIVDDLDIDCGVGKIDAVANVSNSINAKCGVGEIILTLEQSQNYFNYDINVGIGDVEIGKESYSGLGYTKKISNDSESNFKVDCGIGSMKVSFMGE